LNQPNILVLEDTAMFHTKLSPSVLRGYTRVHDENEEGTTYVHKRTGVVLSVTGGRRKIVSRLNPDTGFWDCIGWFEAPVPKYVLLFDWHGALDTSYASSLKDAKKYAQQSAAKKVSVYYTEDYDRYIHTLESFFQTRSDLQKEIRENIFSLEEELREFEESLERELKQGPLPPVSEEVKRQIAEKMGRVSKDEYAPDFYLRQHLLVGSVVFGEKKTPEEIFKERISSLQYKVELLNRQLIPLQNQLEFLDSAQINLESPKPVWEHHRK
jgi:hypothetical protein